MIVLRSLVGAIANARPAGLPVPAVLRRADRAGRATSRCTCNDRTAPTPALSDGDVGDFRPLLARPASVLDRADLRWAATRRSRTGSPPRDRMRGVPDRRLRHAAQRVGRRRPRPYADERWGVFDCGPLGDGGHGHYDHLAVELWGGGRPLVLDPGRFTYADGDDGWRRLVQGHRGPQHGVRRRARPDPVPAGQAEGPDVDGAASPARWR